MNSTLPGSVSGPSVWVAADWADDNSWLYRFSETELAELDAALNDVRRRGLAARAFGKDDFTLPPLARGRGVIQEELENGRGFVQFRGISADSYDLEDLEFIYWGIGAHLGEAISQNAKGDLIGHVTDLGHGYNQRNVRGYTTNAALTPHTDSPSDVVGLLCVRPATSGGASVIASSIALYNKIATERPEYLEIFTEGFHHDLRGEGPTGRDDEISHNKIPIYSYFAGRLSCNFNSKSARTVPDKTGVPLTPLQLEAFAYMEEIAALPEYRLDIDFQAGDMQFVHNYSIMHWREGFTDDHDPSKKRLLLRLWLNLPNGRPLEPGFAHRFNVGPRQGVPVKAEYR